MKPSEGDAESKAALLKELEELRKLVPKLERLSEEHRRAERLQAALYAIADLASVIRDKNDFFGPVHHIIGGLMEASNFYVALYNPVAEVLTFPYFVDSVDPTRPNDLPWETIKRGMTAYVLRKGKPMLVDRAQVDAMVEAGDIEYVGSPPASWLGVPLFDGGEIAGTLVIQSYDDYRYSEKDADLLIFVAQHVSTALERMRSRDALEARVQERTLELQRTNTVLEEEIAERRRTELLKDALFRITGLANTAQNMADFYEQLHGILSNLIDARNFYISIYDPSKEVLIFPYTVDAFDKRPKPRKLEKGLTEYVLTRGEPALLDQKRIHQLEKEGLIVAKGAPPLHWLGVPLIYRDEVCGMLAVQSYNDEVHFTEKDQELLTFVSHHIAAALERKRAHDLLERRVAERTMELKEANKILEHQIEERKRIEQRLIHDALHDALTGLPNRTLFMDRLVQSMKRMSRDFKELFAVLFLDLDRFKVINDSLGHMIGDELLKEVSRRIQACLRGSDTVARMGGDEFAILMTDIKGIEEPKTIAQRIRERLEVPFLLDDRQVFTSTSVGIALAHPRYTKPEDLLRDADAAMYRAKAGGRDRFVIFDESMHQEALELLELESDLRNAVEEDAFEVYYQPVIHVESGQAVGFEALARWAHPSRGLLLPEDFVSIAEETDLIMALDWRIIHKAACQLSEWRNRFPKLRPLLVSVNVSSKHFARPDFVNNLRVVLKSAGLLPRHIKLEVREGALLDNLSSVNKVLEELSDIGVRLLLDDFGTRYSSLSNLHRFPMEMLKIDRTFISNMLEVHENLAIVRTIRALADTLDMPLIAEGIESKALLNKIKDIGCQYVQGHYISRPLNVQQAERFLADGARAEV